MRRKIKFRFFCPPAKGFVEQYNYKGAVDDLFGEEDLTLIPSQYTGVNDCDGKEIWEGDIIEYKRPGWEQTFNALIDFDKGAFVAKIIKSAGTFQIFTLFQANEFVREIRVVGNKFENPELIY